MPKAVVVEDREDVSRVTVKMLEHIDIEVVKTYVLPSEFDEAGGWEEADIVLMDNRFGPYGNTAELGSEYLMRIFTDPKGGPERTGGAKYCLMSGDFDTDEGAVRKLNILGIHYLAKPFSLGELANTTRSMLDGRQLFWKPRPPINY